MASDLYTGNNLVVQNEENALWALEKGNFPVTLYDRPGLALSNLLLRGDVDAATRSMLSPQSLTPAEMKTFSGYIKGDGKNKVLNTIADVVTNPIVLLGVIMAFKYPIGSSDAIFKIGEGLAKGAPGALISKAQGAFSNLRNIPYAFKTLSKMAIESGNMSTKYGEKFNGVIQEYIAKTGQKLTEADWLKIHAHASGFNEVPKFMMKDGKSVMIPLRGTRKAAYSVYEVLNKKTPVWPGLQGQMSPELVKLSNKIGSIYKDFHGNFTGDKKAWLTLQKEMAAKGYGGISLGDFMQHYQPIYAKFSPLEGVAAQSLMGAGEYHGAIGRAGANIAGALRPAMGVTIGDISQLRKMEKLGMPPVADKLIDAFKKDSTRMASFLGETWNRVRGITNPTVRANEFATQVMERAVKNKMNTRLRLGRGAAGTEALKQVSYQLDAASVDPKTLGQKIAGLSDVLTSPAQYDMRPIQGMRRYLTQMSSSWAYHMAPVDDTLKVAAQAYYPEAQGGSLNGYKKLLEPMMESVRGVKGFQHNYMKDQLLPMLRGLKPHNAYARASIMGQYKDQVGLWLRTHPLGKKLPPATREHLEKTFGNFSSLSSESIGAKISEFFYVSTLGLNMAPASKNLLQNLITTAHMPGINKAGFSSGMKQMMQDVGKYVGHLKGGMSRDAAWTKAFPEYVRETGEAAGMTHAMKIGDVAKEGLAGKIAGGGLWEKGKDIMLTPFATSEAFNRLFGFYVGKHSYLATNPGAIVKAREFGAMVNQMAHFPGGPLGMPRALLGTWGPARQFMHFPLRYAGFLGGSTQWMGKGASLGQKYRTLATGAGLSAGAYTVAKDMFGVDLSQGLMTGALPVPSFENAPFYPWPLVPPVAAVAGEAVKSIASGELGGLGRTASLMVPGGVAMRRLYKTLGPKYAKYEARTEDGRVPVFNDSKALIGAFTPWQLFMKSVGLAPTSQQAEYGAAKWLLTQREKVRSYRRDFLEAISDNDIRKSDQINKAFQKAYPEMGPLQVKKSDVTAIHNRREVSRLQRILKGFPKAYQPLFSHMISQSGLAGVTQKLEGRPTAIDEYGSMMNQ